MRRPPARPRQSDDDDQDPPDWAPIEPPDHVLRIPSSPPRRPNPAAFPITGMVPKSQRRSPWGLLLRIFALTLLLATAAALGAGRLGVPIPGRGFEAILAAPTPTETVPGSPAETQPAVALLPDEQTAIAVGVGGAAQETPAAEPAAVAENEPPAETAEPQADAETPVPVGRDRASHPNAGRDRHTGPSADADTSAGCWHRSSPLPPALRTAAAARRRLPDTCRRRTVPTRGRRRR